MVNKKNGRLQQHARFQNFSVKNMKNANTANGSNPSKAYNGNELTLKKSTWVQVFSCSNFSE